MSNGKTIDPNQPTYRTADGKGTITSNATPSLAGLSKRMDIDVLDHLAKQRESGAITAAEASQIYDQYKLGTSPLAQQPQMAMQRMAANGDIEAYKQLGMQQYQQGLLNERINADDKTNQQAADNLGFERDKFAKTNELERQSQEANQRYKQGLLDNQNRQTALQESSAQWEREKPSQKLDDIKNNLHSALIDAAKSGDNDKFEQVANTFKKYHAITNESKKEKLKTSYKDMAGNEIESERLADANTTTSPEETRKIIERMAKQFTPKDDKK